RGPGLRGRTSGEPKVKRRYISCTGTAKRLYPHTSIRGENNLAINNTTKPSTLNIPVRSLRQPPVFTSPKTCFFVSLKRRSTGLIWSFTLVWVLFAHSKLNSSKITSCMPSGLSCQRRLRQGLSRKERAEAELLLSERRRLVCSKLLP